MAGARIHSAATSRAPRARRRHAFTLIEILCVVVVMAIVSSIVIPQINDSDDLNVAAGSRQVMADLLYAQNRAITTQQMQYVVFDAASQNFTLYDSMATPLTPITHPVNQTSYVEAFGAAGAQSLSDCTLTSANFDGQTAVAFDETGAPYSYNTLTKVSALLTNVGAIIVQSDAASQTIAIAPATGDITCN